MEDSDLPMGAMSLPSLEQRFNFKNDALRMEAFWRKAVRLCAVVMAAIGAGIVGAILLMARGGLLPTGQAEPLAALIAASVAAGWVLITVYLKRLKATATLTINGRGLVFTSLGGQRRDLLWTDRGFRLVLWIQTPAPPPDPGSIDRWVLGGPGGFMAWPRANDYAFILRAARSHGMTIQARLTHDPLILLRKYQTVVSAPR